MIMNARSLDTSKVREKDRYLQNESKTPLDIENSISALLVLSTVFVLKILVW